MQLIVLGMHRSGTSMVTRLLNLMGAYFGPEGASIGANEENPKGFWERRDVRRLNDALLASAGATWHDVARFEVAVIPDDARRRFVSLGRRLVLELDAHRPWVLKEPRLCLLLPLWRPLLELPVCILVHRSPLQVAHSLRARNGMPLELGAALWERYLRDALAASQGLPRLLVDYEAMLVDPALEIDRLHGRLTELGVAPLRLPAVREVEAFVDRHLQQQQQTSEELSELLSDEQRSLWRALREGRILEMGAQPLSATARDVLMAHHESGRQDEGRGAEASPSVLASHDELLDRNRALERQLRQTRGWLERLRHHYREQGRYIHRLRRERWLGEERLTLVRDECRRRERETAEARRERERAEQAHGTERARIHERLRSLVEELEELKVAYRGRTAGLSRLREEHRGLEKRLRRVESVNRDVFSSRTWRLASSLSALYGLITLRRWRVPSSGRAPPGGKARPKPPPPAAADPPAASFAPAVDIVVCVHNALEYVRPCLQSVLEKTSPEFRLILVNDGSDEATSEFLRRFASACPESMLLESDTATGYTRAANRGLRASVAELVVLLNSDTLVTEGWLEGLMEVARSSPEVGIIGPLSNAASWQSVPRRFAPEGGWAVNQLPRGVDPDRMARLVAAASLGQNPRVPFINGFCYVIRRQVIEAIGCLDEETFPWGYGEENDYSLRAAAAGFELAVADKVYVYHAKTKSYSSERRSKLSRGSNAALAAKHGAALIETGLQEIREKRGLAIARQRVARGLEWATTDAALDEAPKVLYVLSVRGGGGGAHSVVQEASAIRRLGHGAEVAVRRPHLELFRERYPDVAPETFVPYLESSLADLAARYDVAVATVFTSAKLVAEMCEHNPRLLPAYYIQDYEPWFVADYPELEAEALASYTLMPRAVLFAKTEWLCRLVSEKHGVRVHKVTPSLDTDLFFPAPRPPALEAGGGPVRVAAMIRPQTPRRGARVTMEVLAQVWARLGSGLESVLFGCAAEDPEFLALPRTFPFEQHGVLRRDEVAELLRRSEIFIDFSTYQAFGRTALEAMACGCATIVPQRGGASEFARHQHNALVVDTSSRAAMERALEGLARDPELRRRLALAGLEAATRYSLGAAAASELELFRGALEQRRRSVARTPPSALAPGV